MALTYSPDEIFNLLANVTCHRDLIEIEHYIMSNVKAYTRADRHLFYKALSIYWDIFIKPEKE